MANFFDDNVDLSYYFDEGIDWAELVAATEVQGLAAAGFASTADAVSSYREIAKLVGEFVASEVAPAAAAIDRRDMHVVDGERGPAPELDALFKKIKELDLHGLNLPRELGGMNAPMMLYFINSEMFARGDVSVMAHHGFHGGMAMAMLMFSLYEGTSELDVANGKVVRTRWAKEIAEIARGDAWGCMDITEPDAGSDMAQLRCRGEQDAAGNWFVSGQKIFITSGHGKYHFVIARTEEASGSPDDPMAGLAGLSMFLVPTHQDGKRVATLDRIEEKLGHHGSVTAALGFDRTPAQLVGRRGEGFRYMLILMNNARLGVGFESIGLCEAALRMAREYAAQRPSMGKTVDRHEMIADYLDEMEIDIVAIRALAMHGAYHEELGQKKKLFAKHGAGRTDLDAARLQREGKQHEKLARRVTPLLKYLASEKAVEMARRNLQIHGGNGYMKEYGAEKLLRDAIVMPIYEGTSQIQALMAMKDTLGGIMKNPQEFVRRTAQARWRSLSARDPLERRVAALSMNSLAAQRHLITRTAADKVKGLAQKPVASWPDELIRHWNPKRDFAFAMLHAERLIKILADEAVCDILLAQGKKHPHRRALLERYLERAEPRVRFLLDEITTTGQRLLDKLATPTAAERIA
jgi:3-(methylthio)propanoyl-CoA dehydrogenase